MPTHPDPAAPKFYRLCPITDAFVLVDQATEPMPVWSEFEPEACKNLSGPEGEKRRAELAGFLTTTAKAAGVTVSATAAARPDLDLQMFVPRLLFNRVRHVSEADVRFCAAYLLAAARTFHSEHVAWSHSIRLPRRKSEPLRIRLSEQISSKTDSLRSLLAAAKKSTPLRLEVRWRQTSPAARVFVQKALDEIAPEALVAYVFDGYESGPVLSALMPSRDLLKLVLPRAIELAGNCHGRRFDREEAMLATCRHVFRIVTLSDDDQLTVGGLDVPSGQGADFVRDVEAILGIEILSENSRHRVHRMRATKELRRERHRLLFAALEAKRKTLF